eukprot:537933-Amphidinium_carterae.1
MHSGDRIACCRCTHQCHSSCRYTCEGEVDVVIVRQIIFGKIRPLTLLCTREGGDRILQREYHRVQVLAELAGTGPRDSAPMTGGAAISVHGSVDGTEKVRESRPLETGAARGVLSPAAPMEEASMLAVASLRTP